MALAGLFFVAILGPWTFDLIVVPAQYSCNKPATRLLGDYCGMPMSGTLIFFMVGGRLIELIGERAAGENAIVDPAKAFLQISLFTVLALLLLLPIFSSLLLVLRGENRRRHLFYRVSLGLAACAGVLWGIEISSMRWSWALWGLWLYVVAAVGGLILELWMAAVGRRVEKESQGVSESQVI
jgi:hypothetical protein